MEHQIFIRQQNLKLYRSLVAASEAAAAKADARHAGMSSLTCQQIVFVMSVDRSAVCGLGSTPSPLTSWTGRLLSASAVT
jgi:hypothetical protein